MECDLTMGVLGAVSPEADALTPMFGRLSFTAIVGSKRIRAILDSPGTQLLGRSAS